MRVFFLSVFGNDVTKCACALSKVAAWEYNVRVMENTPNEGTILPPRRAYIGFSVFDIIHVASSIFLIVHCYNQPIIDVVQIAESTIIIVFSMLLMAFIAVLAKRELNPKMFHSFYSFAWLVASASLLVYPAFSFPEAIVGGYEESEAVALTLSAINAMFALGVFLFFGATLFVSQQSRRWNAFIHIGTVLACVLATSLFVTEFFIKMEPVERVFECAEDVALLVPAIIGISMFNNPAFRME